MICYLDTSALVKLYVAEEGTPQVRQHIREAVLTATAKIAYAEARAALARCFREGVLDELSYREAVGNLNVDWPSYFVMEITDYVIFKAGELAERYAIRGFDSIHMASAYALAEKIGMKNLIVGCWDNRLSKALRSANFTAFP